MSTLVRTCPQSATPDERFGVAARPSAAVSDEQLARQAALGDRGAFTVLVERYDERLYRFAFSRLRNAEDASEVVQQTLLNAWRAIKSYESRFRFGTWVLSIAHRECVNVIRHRARVHRDVRRQIELDAFKHDGPVTDSGVWALAHRVLDGPSYEALWLRYVEDRTPREIARIMARTSVGVRVLLHRARARLGAIMDEEGRSQ